MISVVIPVLNEEKCIRDCFESLKKQDYKGEWEVILVDGQSTDKTREIAKEYTKNIIVEPPRGPGNARNIGAKTAKYPIVAFIDSDCIAPEHWLSEIAKQFEDEKLVGLGGVLRPSDARTLDRVMFKLNADWWVRISALLGIYQLYGNNCAYRLEAFKKLGGFNTKVSFWEDTELSMRAKRMGKLHIDGSLYVYTSTRRFRQMGYIKVAWVNVKAFFNFSTGREINTKYFQEIKHG
ncbi:MAG: glycosyltransferase [Candidatus Micrarchaeota archaeon]|nr:glycosyltransferase [Candidatus Micrarchaeota archaeon]